MIADKLPSQQWPVVACGQVGQWLLIVGPHSVRPILANVIVGLALEEAVRVLDCGRVLSGIEIPMHLRDRPEALEQSQFYACGFVPGGAEGSGRNAIHRCAVRGAESAQYVLR